MSEDSITLTIDGKTIEAESGQTIMQVARDADLSIPSLCDSRELKGFGSCRMCVVEIGGRPGTSASCTTPAADGMVVNTQTDKLWKLRRGIVELYVSEHPLDCLTCSANGDCELQDVSAEFGLRDMRYDVEPSNTKQ